VAHWTGNSEAEGAAFTIDEHRARTHHFDLRLMLDGAVALWAVAAGMPRPGDTARTAILLEELPINLREAVTASGQRTLWDEGTMTVRTWLEGEVIVVTLHGAASGGLGGKRTLSLLHVGSARKDDDHWTITALDQP
jgi:bifunctional non-homologous end joining protein LigD